MNAIKQVSKVLAISLVLVFLIIGSIWLAGMDPQSRPTPTSILPSVTLHPTLTPTSDAPEPAPTQTPVEPSLTPSLTATASQNATETPILPSATSKCNYPTGWTESTLNNQDIYALEKLSGTDLSIEEILIRNCRPANTPLTIGLVLYLPELPTSSVPTLTPTPLGDQCIVRPTAYKYIVKHGDTLYGLARWMGLSVEQLRHINCLTGNYIYPGNILYSNKPIPAPYTPTPTVMPTFTKTVPPTPTPTLTPTLTPTPTPTPTAATPTFTPTATQTPTPSPVPPTSTPTPTPGGGFIPTPVPTDDSETATPTPQPTNTPIPTATENVDP